MRYIVCALLVVLMGCFTRPAIIHRQSFDEIQIGTTVEELKKKVGEPRTIRATPSGGEEYEYVENLYIENEVVEKRLYYFSVQNGKVTSKRTDQQTPPAYDQIYDDDPNDVELQ
jgi:hypothetical protein